MFRLDASTLILFRNRVDIGVILKAMIGTEIGNYRIVDKLGEGGMGVVYKAIDTQLDRVVAVKALSPEFSANATLLERFRREARAQAQLNHPNLATLYALLVQDGAAYMVMEFVDGETLYDMLLRRGVIPAEEICPLFRQALAGIGYAHRLGIIHRDIKPSNIMLNQEGVVKVMDFGLAKVAGNHAVTRTGVRLGTAYYMSPEQVLVKPVDGRSDIYSLGATLYEMLTGQAPFDAESEFEILNDHVNTPPPPPTRLRSQIPPGIENAVLKALAKNPEDRFQTAEQFSAALERPAEFYAAVTGADTTTVPAERRITVAEAPAASIGEKPPPAFWTGRRKTMAAGGALLACLLAGWLIFRFRPGSGQAVAPAPAAAQRPNSIDAAKTSAPAATPPKPVHQTEKLVVEKGTRISVVTVDPIDSKDSEQMFVAKLAAPVTSGDRVVFHEGAEVRLRFGDPGEGQNKKEKILQLVSITTGRHSYEVTGSAQLPKRGNLFERLPIIGKNKVPPGTPVEFTLDERVTVNLPPG
jgi:serine/threonine-protein kinase